MSFYAKNQTFFYKGARELWNYSLKENNFYFLRNQEKEFYTNLFYNWHVCLNSSKLSSMMHWKDHCLGD